MNWFIAYTQKWKFQSSLHDRLNMNVNFFFFFFFLNVNLITVGLVQLPNLSINFFTNMQRIVRWSKVVGPFQQVFKCIDSRMKTGRLRPLHKKFNLAPLCPPPQPGPSPYKYHSYEPHDSRDLNVSLSTTSLVVWVSSCQSVNIYSFFKTNNFLVSSREAQK